MAENNINFKISKPTLKPPSDMGKKIDSKFKNKMNNVGVNINMIKESTTMINEKEESLKKKIFNLPKMETLVMTDEYLSNIYNKLKEDAQETYGYHWNETIMNIMFNEYVLNDTAYLQKYKNTKTYNKKRRGEEGVEELERELQDKIDYKKADGEKPNFGRDEKMKDIETNKDQLDNFKKSVEGDKEKDSVSEVVERMKRVIAEAENVEEIFGLGKPAEPLTTHKPSKNDTYLVRKKDNTAVGVISPNLSQQQNQDAANKFADPNQYTRMPWNMAIQNKVKGVPAEVQDAQPGEFDALQKKYDGVPTFEAEKVDEISPETFKSAVDVSRERGQDRRTYNLGSQFFYQFVGKPLFNGTIKEIGVFKPKSGAYYHVSIIVTIQDVATHSPKDISIYYDIDGDTYDLNNEMSRADARMLSLIAQKINPNTKYKNGTGDFRIKGYGMSEEKSKLYPSTQASGFEPQFNTATPKEGEKAANNDTTYNNDLIYQNETTTSASSGAFVGPFPGKRKAVLDKPLWSGGVIIKEGVNYLTGGDGFKSYVNLMENVDQLEKMINESIEENNGITIKQHAQNILAQLDRMKRENPELENVPEFGELVTHYNNQLQTGSMGRPQPQQQVQRAAVPKQDSTQQWSTNEHHLKSKDEKILFINKNGGGEIDALKAMNDAAIENLYLQIEKQKGVSETPDHDAAIKKELLYSGKNVPPNASTAELESEGGLFNVNVQEKAKSKAQQKFMGMVHAAQKGDFDNPSHAVEKAASSISDKDAKDFASTKHKGLPDHVKEGLPVQQGGNDIFSRIGKLVYPHNDKNPQELSGIGQQFVKDFGGVFKNMSPDQIFQSLEKSSKTYGLGESMIDDQPDSMARTMDSPELNTSGTGGGTSPAPSTIPVTEKTANASAFDPDDDGVGVQGDRQNKETMADAAKFRSFLKSKYGVENVADLSPTQKRQIMKDLAVAKGGEVPATAPAAKPELDVTQFRPTDAQRSEYQARDNKQLGYVAANAPAIKSLADYVAMEKRYATENGERMFHPMAILASIQAMPAADRARFQNVERVLTAKMKGGIEESKNEKTNKMNEERQTPSMLNLEKVKKETAKLTQQVMADSDALKQAKVYPDPDEFYIEQDEDKIQQHKSAEDLEKEALQRVEDIKAMKNAGDSTNNNGDELQKRNLTKDEMLRLAMNRGDGMHNIVYDNKPSERFEKRLEKDMGEDQYKLRQEKMDYREDAPMYNKDTQPTEKGIDKDQDDKFKVGFNEAFTGKYVDDYGRNKLVEFMMSDVKEVAEVKDGYKLSLDGLGNKYTVKINENKVYHDVANKFDFYLVEGKVVKTKPGELPAVITDDVVARMQKLMNYKSGEFVNSKKSMRF